MSARKPYLVQAVAKLLGTTVDSVRRSVDESSIKIGRRETGPQTRLFTPENVFELAAWRASKAKSNRRSGKRITATIYAPKGGVGKTTLAANFACLFSLLGARTLVVDLDFQSNLTLAMGYDSEITQEEATREGILSDRVVNYHFGHLMPEWPNGQQALSDVIKMPYGISGPHLIPADLTLDRLDTLLTWEIMGGKNADAKIGRLIEEGRSGKNPKLDLSEYDVILFDAAPAKNRMTRGALLASDFVITPVSMEKFSTKALSYLSQVLDDLQEQMGRRPEQIIVGNFFDANRVRVIATAMQITQSYQDAWLESTIRRSESIPRLLATNETLPISMAVPSDEVSGDIRSVAEALLVRMGVLNNG